MKSIAHEISGGASFSYLDHAKVEAARAAAVCEIQLPVVGGADAPQGECSKALVFQDGSRLETGNSGGYYYPVAGLHAAAVALGRKGGQATSEAKTEAARVNAKRGGRPRKQTDDFEYAVQIQPRNGQQLVEYREGLTLTYRDWNNADRKRHPQAERQLWDGACLVVDLDTDNVYAVEKP
jgi:hypothetical protein